MPRLTHRGVEFNVRTIGDGPMVVMVHGLLTGSLASWYLTVAPDLAETNRVLCYDLRGHGRSAAPPSGYGISEMAEDLRALTDQEPAPMVIVGHSFGGLVALRFALDHPELVRGIALVEAPLLDEDPGDPDAWIDELIPGARQDLSAPISVDTAAGDTPQRGDRRRVERMQNLVRNTSLVSDLRSDSAFSFTEIANMDCPVLALVGEQSPSMAGRHHLAGFDHVTVQTLPGGHDLHVDNPGGVTTALRHFLDELPEGQLSSSVGPSSTGADQ